MGGETGESVREREREREVWSVKANDCVGKTAYMYTYMPTVRNMYCMYIQSRSKLGSSIL